MSVGSLAHFRELVRPAMDAIARTRPVFSALFAEGNQDLQSFTRGFSLVNLPSIQDRSDYVDLVSAHVGAAQGEIMAGRVRARLQRSPVVNTANHLCLESLPLTVQSMILAGLGEDPESVLPVEACGSIPADNASFPSGLLLARRVYGKMLRVPILDLSRKRRRQMTWTLDSYGQEDLVQAASKSQSFFKDGLISASERDALMCVIEDVLAASSVVDRPLFREQVSAAVPHLWDSWFTPAARKRMPAIAYTSYESIRIPLLLKDVLDPGTLAHQILFDHSLCLDVMTRLDGIPGCWTAGGRAGGSALFWWVSPDRRTYPMTMEDGGLVTPDGNRFDLVPGIIADGLMGGVLMPTIFLTLMVGLARGLVQIGGFSQIDYLSTMQRRLSAVLAAKDYMEWAQKLAVLPPPMLTAGLAAVAVDYGEEEIRSAGGIEMIAHGGLTPEELDRMRLLQLRESMALELPGIARMVLGDRDYERAAIPEVHELVKALDSKLPIFRL